jgi:hypothetical protein
MSNDITPTAYVSPFDQIRHVDEDGECWYARELQTPLEYKWEGFHDTIERAMTACTNSGESVEINFRRMSKVNRGERGPSGTDYRLTQFACYLIAMNGDPRKTAIAQAQAYFAIKTREAEVLGSELDPEIRQLIQMSLALQQTRNEQRRLAEVQEQQKQAIVSIAARVDSIEHNTEFVTALAYAKQQEFPLTDTATMSRLGGIATKMMKVQGETPKKTRDQRYGFANLYPEYIIAEALEKLTETMILEGALSRTQD